ncbi:MAG: sulfotransferase [Alphaproteobacteria bacterium]|nr:sulfotransferase [Alphaproteobacteria bacterium]
MNAALAESAPRPSPLDAPVLFVSGAPRSGTTLMAQALIRYFDLGFVDNLTARFWQAPQTGMTLSQSVFGESRLEAASSDFGRTAGRDIHGFHFFWMEKLALEWVDDLFEDPARRGVDWREIQGWIAGMQRLSRAGFLFKGYYPSYFMPQFLALDPLCVFVCIERDPIEQALSVYDARQKEMLSLESWWSMQPPDYYELVDKDVDEQILGQITGLNAHFRQLASQAGDRCIFVRYENLCSDPEGTLIHIGEAVEKATGFALSRRGLVPEITRTHRKSDKSQAALVARLVERLAQFEKSGDTA